MALSARNQLSGKIKSIQIGDIMAHVTVKVGENLIERDDGNAGCGEEFHVAAKGGRRHGDDRAGVVDGVIGEDCRPAGLDHDFSVG